MHLTGSPGKGSPPPAFRVLGVGVCAALIVGAVVGCVPAGDSAGAASGAPEWAEFGPFERPAGDTAEPYLTGPGTIRLPDGTAAELDASELLGGGIALPARDDYEIVAESYSYTQDADGDSPVIVGIVQTSHEMVYRGYSEFEHVTFVLGISAEAQPREVSRTRVLRGGPHAAAFAGRSDLGVVAVHLDGELVPGGTPESRVIGVDAVRGTEVWVKEPGYPVYGDGTATFLRAPAPDRCVSDALEYDVASGNDEQRREYPPASPGDPDCLTPGGAAG
ncbi:hypothetical protein NHL51_11820 [Leucobacter sp. gxy201]|uniref:hypothetical protein n=1 Tax=Leucobacter sp. gxy201 TaxID=2957200 RepID=UPI003DA0FE6F